MISRRAILAALGITPTLPWLKPTTSPFGTPMPVQYGKTIAIPDTITITVNSIDNARAYKFLTSPSNIKAVRSVLDRVHPGKKNLAGAELLPGDC